MCVAVNCSVSLHTSTHTVWMSEKEKESGHCVREREQPDGDIGRLGVCACISHSLTRSLSLSLSLSLSPSPSLSFFLSRSLSFSLSLCTQSSLKYLEMKTVSINNSISSYTHRLWTNLEQFCKPPKDGEIALWLSTNG